MLLLSTTLRGGSGGSEVQGSCLGRSTEDVKRSQKKWVLKSPPRDDPKNTLNCNLGVEANRIFSGAMTSIWVSEEEVCMNLKSYGAVEA